MLVPSSRSTPGGSFADWPGGSSFGDARGSAWFLPEGALCVRVTAAQVDVPLAQSYMHVLRAIRDGEREAIARAGGLRLYQDLHAVTLIDRAARAYLLDVARTDFGWRVIRSNKMEIAPLNPLVRTALQLITRAMTQTGLPPIAFSDNLASDLERDGIRAPRLSPPPSRPPCSP